MALTKVSYSMINGDAVNVLDYGAVADGVTDCSAAFQSAVDTGKAVFVPDTGDTAFYLASPIDSVQYTAIFGNAEVQVGGTRTARIYAPAGFLVNPTSPASRHRISLQNIEVYGAGAATAGVKGIDGQYGGLIEGCYFHDFDIVMENNMAYLLDFVRCKFEDANIGLYLSTANETNVTNCFFGSSCVKPIDTYNLTPGTGGDRAAKPFSVTNTNFNFGTSAVPSVFSGQVRFVGNYGEAFSAPSGSTALFEYVAMRFANATLYIADNHLNGQANVDRCWHVYSDNVSGSTIQGLITRNWMRGYNDLPILIGDKTGFYNRVVGIEVVNNQVNSLQYVDYDSTQSAIPYEQVAQLSYSGSLSVAGTTYVAIPFTLDSGFIADVSGTAVNIVQAGLYRITADVQLVYNSEYRGCEIRTSINGSGTSFLQTLPTVVSGGNNYHTMHVETVAYLNLGDDVEIDVRNGETVSKARLTVEKIPGANQYQGY